jgi:hypothetical protein
VRIDRETTKWVEQAAELVPAYVFFASQESGYVSARVLGVTGGSPLA